jgi:hypothetical protein
VKHLGVTKMNSQAPPSLRSPGGLGGVPPLSPTHFGHTRNI